MGVVIGRTLGAQGAPRLDETPLGVVLSARRDADKNRGENRTNDRTSHDGRRRACKVKSSSFIGRLYCSFSSLRMVRLFRFTSSISIVWAVQNPWTFRISE